jgi:tryptophanyl-tRNA synthetase
MTDSPRPVVLTGDTPTGRLHLGHYLGSVKKRIEMLHSHECFFLIANMHAFTTRADHPEEIRQDCIDIVRDQLAMGVDPEHCSIFLQTEVPAISELTYLFSMLLPFNRVMRNPTLKDEIEAKGLGDTYPFGFPLYAVGQTADILAFRAHNVPVGEDQEAHLELTREVARRFNKMYCGVPLKVDDADHVEHGGVFPIPVADLSKVTRLVGTDGKQKMSKSLNNTIMISDTPKKVKKKVGQIFTGRQSPTEKGDTSNALFQYVDAFILDPERIAELRDRYARGDDIGDGHIKVEVADAINELLDPMRERLAAMEGKDDEIMDILKVGTANAIKATEETLDCAKEAASLHFFDRSITLK